MIGVVVFTSRIWTDLRSHDLYLPSPRLHAALVFLLPSSYPPPLLISFCSPWGLLLFPRTVRRYHKDQITMVTISHIVIAHTLVWWLFLFWTVGGCCPYLTGGAPSNLFWCRRNNVAIYWIHAFAQSERRWITSNAPVMTHHSQSHGKEDRLNCMSQSYSSSLKRIHVHRGSALERSPAILCIGKWWNWITGHEVETNVRDNISRQTLAECYPWKSWNCCCSLGAN